MTTKSGALADYEIDGKEMKDTSGQNEQMPDTMAVRKASPHIKNHPNGIGNSTKYQENQAFGR